jgi:endo-1,4-beta-D-glucanase Y
MAAVMGISVDQDTNYYRFPSIKINFSSQPINSVATLEGTDKLEGTNTFWLSLQNNVHINETNEWRHPQANVPSRFFREKIQQQIVPSPINPKQAGTIYPTDSNATYNYNSANNTHTLTFKTNNATNLMIIPLNSSWTAVNISKHNRLKLEVFGTVQEISVTVKDANGVESSNRYIIGNIQSNPTGTSIEIPLSIFTGADLTKAKEIIVRPVSTVLSGNAINIRNLSIVYIPSSPPETTPLLLVPLANSFPLTYQKITKNADYRQTVMQEWHDFVNTYIDSYLKLITDPRVKGLVFDPYSGNSTTAIEATDKAYSEGVGYGLILSAYMNDQETFERILNAALDSNMYQIQGNGLFCWRIGTDGTVNYPTPSDDRYSATDADQDIALVIIFADRLVKSGFWKPTDNNYHDLAKMLLGNIWRSDIVQNGATWYIKPGDRWTLGTSNPSYFSPAAYRVFDQFDRDEHGDQIHPWLSLIDEGYDLIMNRTAGASRGLAPDWCQTFNGQAAPGRSYVMGKDGIRVLWRLATDAVWFNEPRAREFLERPKSLFNGFGGSINMAQIKPLKMDGTAADTYTDISLIAMYAAGAMGSTNTSYRTAWKTTFDNFQPSYGVEFNYYNRSLKLLGEMLLGGLMPNLENK